MVNGTAGGTHWIAASDGSHFLGLASHLSSEHRSDAVPAEIERKPVGADHILFLAAASKTSARAVSDAVRYVTRDAALRNVVRASVSRDAVLAAALRDVLDEEHALVIESIVRSTQFKGMDVLDPDATARAMTASLRKPSDGWARVLGPCYTLSGLAERLHVTPQAVSKRAGKLRLLRVLDEDGRALFPAFALTEELAPVRGLHEVLRRLTDSGYSSEPSTWAWWLRTPHPDLDQRAPIDALNGGAPLDDVLDAIDRDAWVLRAS